MEEEFGDNDESPTDLLTTSKDSQQMSTASIPIKRIIPIKSRTFRCAMGGGR